MFYVIKFKYGLLSSTCVEQSPQTMYECSYRLETPSNQKTLTNACLCFESERT